MRAHVRSVCLSFRLASGCSAHLGYELHEPHKYILAEIVSRGSGQVLPGHEALVVRERPSSFFTVTKAFPTPTAPHPHLFFLIDPF